MQLAEFRKILDVLYWTRDSIQTMCENVLWPKPVVHHLTV